jgi:hypothetical protein
MDYGKFRCRHCGKLKRRRTAEQSYCGASECQKARKNAWRRAKYSTDADYRANHRESTNTWLEEQGGSAAYHRAYRRRLKESMPTESIPAVRSEEPTSANSDALFGESSFESGIYALTPITRESDANSDALLARIDFIPGGYRAITNIDSIGEEP